MTITDGRLSRLEGGDRDDEEKIVVIEDAQRPGRYWLSGELLTERQIVARYPGRHVHMVVIALRMDP